MSPDDLRWLCELAGYRKADHVRYDEVWLHPDIDIAVQISKPSRGALIILAAYVKQALIEKEWTVLDDFSCHLGSFAISLHHPRQRDPNVHRGRQTEWFPYSYGDAIEETSAFLAAAVDARRLMHPDDGKD